MKLPRIPIIFCLICLWPSRGGSVILWPGLGLITSHHESNSFASIDRFESGGNRSRQASQNTCENYPATAMSYQKGSKEHNFQATRKQRKQNSKTHASKESLSKVLACLPQQCYPSFCKTTGMLASTGLWTVLHSKLLARSWYTIWARTSAPESCSSHGQMSSVCHL